MYEIQQNNNIFLRLLQLLAIGGQVMLTCEFSYYESARFICGRASNQRCAPDVVRPSVEWNK